MVFYAHSNEKNRDHWQLLKNHLLGASEKAACFGETAGIGELSRLAALMHDLGKYSFEFQKRLQGSAQKVDHATAGAQEIFKLFGDDQYSKYVSTLLAYCIAGHHGGLPDYGSSFDTTSDSTLCGRLKRDLPRFQSYQQELEFPENLPLLPSLRPTSKTGGFTMAFLTRMAFSALVDGDFQDTEEFMGEMKKERGNFTSIPALMERMDLFFTRFANPHSEINQRRSSTLASCLEKAQEKPGLFTLTVPTGGGKTIASMAFALNHAKIHNLSRVIYVIPYTSIIEQNSAVFKEILGADNVLEHHSNFDWRPASSLNSIDEAPQDALQKLKWASENWDVPIVVTTNVQFFESLYSNLSSRCRKLHNLAKSVIIFDEVQMFPQAYLKPALSAIYELIINYGASAVFCTATQPSLDTIVKTDLKPHELMPDPDGLYNFYKRVVIQNLGIITDDELIERIAQYPQALCIVNTRKHALGLFELLKKEGAIHLSTLMCPAHRKQAVAQIKERLKTGMPCRVISTQLIEAGVDLDFPVGFRALSGLDSIIQAAGRVNREGKNDTGILYVFEPDTIFIKRIPAYIEQGASIARIILRRFVEDPISLDAIRAYYAELYDLHRGSNDFDMKNIMGCFEKGIPNVPDFDFRTASENFQLIENDTISVVIPMNEEVVALLNRIKCAPYPKIYARDLQLYTVNIYENEFEALTDKGVIELLNDTYYVLTDMEYYDKNAGLIIPATRGGDAIFFDG
ncbi:MAG: CRISPR-associated helicase Cas3' [Anaerolineae bacterium]|nr:CRISPR-associated helicase Cas3' [Anaerolineae bacterium]